MSTNPTSYYLSNMILQMINQKPFFINIAGYRFTPIQDPAATTTFFKGLCADLDLMGSIYVATEGVNMGLSGNILAIQTFLHRLEQHTLFQAMRFHEMYSSMMPYHKLTVKTKTELVPIEDSSIKVGDFNHQYLTPKELQQWLDEERDFVLLDMRNDFEFQLGTFDTAEQLNLRRFRKLQTKLDEIKKLPTDKPIVTFCTGGIRCEKAGPFLEKQGLKNIYQLEGGIIEYLRQTKGAHWHGHCFVFDDRVSLDTALSPQHFNLCIDCQLILQDDEYQICSACLAIKETESVSV